MVKRFSQLHNYIHIFYLLSCLACLDEDITQEGCVECQSKYASWVNNVHAWVLGPFVSEDVEQVNGCHGMYFMNDNH